MSDDSAGAQDTIVFSQEVAGSIHNGNFITLDGLLSELQYHKIFVFCETIRSVANGDYFVKARVNVYRNGRIAVSLPASVGQDQSNTVISETLLNVFPCLFINQTAIPNVPCSPAQEGITLSLSKSFANALQVIVGHHKHIGVIDKLTFTIDAFAAAGGTSITNFRAVMGVISTANGF